MIAVLVIASSSVRREQRGSLSETWSTLWIEHTLDERGRLYGNAHSSVMAA